MLYRQSESTATRRRVPIHLVDVDDGITPMTGVVATPQLSKNGAAFADTSAAVVEIGNGAYYVQLTAAELDTLGFFIVRCKTAATAEYQIHGRVLSGDLFGSGLGASTYTYTLTRSDTAAPIDDAQVWLTTDSAGTNVVASGRTDAAGQVTFQVDAGTFYLWASKSGFNFSNPQTVVVS